MPLISIAAGIGLLVMSLIACGGSFIAIVDPVGTKMAEDGDPLGPPPSRLDSVSALGVSIGIGAAGIYVVRRSFRPRGNATTRT